MCSSDLLAATPQIDDEVGLHAAELEEHHEVGAAGENGGVVVLGAQGERLGEGAGPVDGCGTRQHERTSPSATASMIFW